MVLSCISLMAAVSCAAPKTFTFAGYGEVKGLFRVYEWDGAVRARLPWPTQELKVPLAALARTNGPHRVALDMDGVRWRLRVDEQTDEDWLTDPVRIPEGTELPPLERLPHFERVADPAGDVGFHAKERRAFTGVPAIAVSKSGERLWMTWYAGITNGEDSNNYCVLSTSTDGGASWKEVLYADPDGPGPSRAFDPQVWVAPDGRLRWFWCQRDDVPVRTDKENRFFSLAEEHRQAAGDRIMMVELDADVEPTKMPESRCIGSGVLACKPIITRAGRWLLPNARWGNGTSARLIESCDGGRTFAEIGGASLPAGIREYDEHSVVELKDGRLRLYMRTRKGPNALWFSESSDGGRTWSASRPCAFCSTNARQCVRR